MPHSVSPDVIPQEDSVLSDAPADLLPPKPEAPDTAMDEDVKLPNKSLDVKLEDLFPDDEEEDEFTSSMPASGANGKTEPNSPPMAAL